MRQAPINYSLVRLMSDLDNGSGTCPEYQYSRNVLEAQVGRPARSGSVFVPLRPTASGLDTKTNIAGGYLRQTDVGTEIIAAYRAKSVLALAGAQTIVDLEGNFSLVVETSGTAAVWSPENPGSDVSETDPVFSVRNLSPKTLLAVVGVSRQLLTQSTPDSERLVRDAFGRTLAEAVDGAGLAGTGTNNQPTGVLRTGGIGDVALGVNGGTLSGDNVIALEQKVGEANATPSAVIASPALRAKLRKTPRFATGTNEPIWRDDNTVLGYPAFATMGIPQNITKGTSTDTTALLIGDFSNVVVAFWNALEVQIDPYTNKKKSSLVELSLFAMADIAVLRPGAFAACQDARP
jgi:HK97 family phage major capsid protein